MKYYKFIKAVLISVPVILLAVLLYKDFNPSGYLKISYDFCRPTPFISKLSPYGRVLDIQHNRGECSQQMVIDPVYFDVRLPQRFERAVLKIWYRKDPQQALKIGPAVNLQQWQWQLKTINYQFSDNAWLVGVASYDLSSVQLDRHNLRFLISSPGLDRQQQRIVFKRLEIEFFNPPLNRQNFWQRFKAWLKFSNLYYLLEKIS